MKIILIVGPSGVGKDSLLKKAKQELGDEFFKEYNFIKRYITRQPDKNEKNFYLEEEALEVLKKNDFFISSWSSHNNTYAIAKNSLKKGKNIISISRGKIKDFEDFSEKVFTINISVSKTELKKRLEKRGREDKDEIQERLNRVYKTIEANNLIDFDNSKDIKSSSKEFISLLKSL